MLRKCSFVGSTFLKNSPTTEKMKNMLLSYRELQLYSFNNIRQRNLDCGR